MQNKVVVRYRDGRILKGFTTDFLPTRDAFHVTVQGQAGTSVRVLLADLKAVFFVKHFTGNSQHQERNAFGPRAIGRRLRVTFLDREELVGTTQGYDPSRPGFFLQPADPDSNIERCFVVRAATTRVTAA